MGTHPIFESDFDCLTDRKSDLKMAAVAYELQNPPTDVKVFYQSKPASSVLQRVKNRLEKDPSPNKYAGTPLMIVWRNSKTSKDFNFTIAKDIGHVDNMSLSIDDIKSNPSMNQNLNKSIKRLQLRNKDI